MPTLNADTLPAMDSVGEAGAIPTTREFSAGLVPNPARPSRNTPITTGTTCAAVNAMKQETASSPVNPAASTPKGKRSAMWPPNAIPMIDPAPYASRTSGTHRGSSPVVSINIAARYEKVPKSAVVETAVMA